MVHRGLPTTEQHTMKALQHESRPDALAAAAAVLLHTRADTQHPVHQAPLTFFGRQKPGTCSPLHSLPMKRISLWSSSIRASWLPASSFCESWGKDQ